MKKIKKFLILMIINLFIGLLIGSAILPKDEVKSKSSNSEFIVCIDPGHQSKADFTGEPIAPGSSNLKNKVSAGTAGVATKKNEYEVNLEASLILKKMLLENGYNVIMTREINDVNISNAERAEIANKANADITIRVHCDSLSDNNKTGASILIPQKSGKFTSSIYNDSYIYGEILMNKLKESGIKVNGIFERSDITGFNWSKVPVVILEMGFMSNYNEDKLLNDSVYQAKIMECVSKAVEEFKVIKVNR